MSSRPATRRSPGRPATAPTGWGRPGGRRAKPAYAARVATAASAATKRVSVRDRWPGRGGQRGEQGDVGDQRDQVGVPELPLTTTPTQVHRGRGDQCGRERGPAANQRRAEAAASSDERRHPADHEQHRELVRALDRCPGVARGEHGGGVGAEADDLVPRRGQRGRGRRDPGQAASTGTSAPSGEPRRPPAAPDERHPTDTSRDHEQHDREDQPADQALLEPARRHRAGAGRRRAGPPSGSAGVEGAHDQQPRQHDQRRAEHLALGRPRRQVRVGQQRHRRRRWPAAPAPAPTSGGRAGAPRPPARRPAPRPAAAARAAPSSPSVQRYAASRTGGRSTQ